MRGTEHIASRLNDKADRLELAFELNYNVPRLTPIRIGIEFNSPSHLSDNTLQSLETLQGQLERFTIRTYRPSQTVGREPLLLNVSFDEGLVLAYLALGMVRVDDLDSWPTRFEAAIRNLQERADAPDPEDGYSFRREFDSLRAQNRDNRWLNVLFQEYIERDHAQRSGRVAFNKDGTGVYSYKQAEAESRPIVRDVETAVGVISGTFRRLSDIPDELMRTRVIQPLRDLVDIFDWKQGVVVEFDYHAVPVGRRSERLIIYDFHEAEVSILDVTGKSVPDPRHIQNPAFKSVVRPRYLRDPREVTERILSSAAGRRGVYISGPITTGEEYYRLLKEVGIADPSSVPTEKEAEFRTRLKNLLERNTKRLKAVAHVLEVEDPEAIIINPGEVTVQEWDQNDYMTLWDRVIRWGVKRIRFLDGWEFSNGAIDEFCLGLELGLELEDERGRPLSRDQALHLLEQAAEIIRSLGYHAAKQEGGIDCLQRLIKERRLHS